MNKVGFSKALLTKRIVFLVVTLASGILICGGIAVYRWEAESYRKDKVDDLNTVAQLKARQIEHWFEERVADTRVVSGSSYLSNGVDLLLNNPTNREVRMAVRNRLTDIADELQHENIILSDTTGNVLLQTKRTDESLPPITRDAVHSSVRFGGELHTEMYVCPNDSMVLLDFVTSLKGAGGKTIAALVFRVDPYDYLFPLLQEWPTVTRTAESMLFQRDGDSVLILNELWHKQHTAMRFHLPLTLTELADVHGATEKRGLFEGLDYRGVRVLSCIEPIHNTNWYIIAKIDSDEVFSALKDKAMMIFGIIVLLISIVSIAMIALYLSNQRSILSNLLASERHLREAHEEFKTTFYSIGDGVLTVGREGGVLQMNKVAEELTGWKEADAIGKQYHEVFSIVNETTRVRVENPIEKVIREGKVVGLANHTLLLSRDGREIPVAYSGAPILVDEGMLKGVVLVFRDQTKERTAARALHESKEKYRTFYEQDLSGDFETTQDGQIVKCNRSFLSIFGFESAEEAFASNVRLLYPPREKTREELFTRLASERILRDYEISMVTHRGKPIRIIANLVGLFNEQDELRGIRGYVFDNTKRYLAEQKIRESEEKYRKMVDILPDAVLIHSSGKIVFANPAALSLVGAESFEQISEIPAIEFVHPDYRQLAVERIRNIYQATESALLVEEKFVRLDGSAVDVEVTAVPIIYLGHPAVQTIVHDITERKRSEEALRESEAKFRTIAMQLQSLIFITDLEGKLVYSSPPMKVMFNIEPEESLGRHFSEFLVQREMPRVIDRFKEMFRTGEPVQNFEVELQRPDGSTFIAAVDATIYGGDSRAGSLGMIRDITEQKRAERELVDAKLEAQKANKLKDEFIATMSHEIRTPLNIIMGYNNLIADIIPETLEGLNKKEVFESINTAGARLIRTVEHVLNISRIRTGTLSFHPSQTDIGNVVERFQADYKRFAAERNLLFQCENYVKGLTVHLDTYLLEQSLSNLLDNAFKFTNEGSIILTARIENGKLVFLVQDTGIGMSEEYLQNLFSPFLQEKSGYTRLYEGLGLGLSLVKNYVTLNSGTITCESTKGEGTTFRIEFPIEDRTIISQQSEEQLRN